MMDRTKQREEFFAHAKQDPYTVMLQRMWSDAWAQGYETARAEIIQTLHEASSPEEGQRMIVDRAQDERYGALRDRATAERTAAHSDSIPREAEALIALGELGRVVDIAKLR